MNAGYGRDLDLNLLRVFVVVADTGSVTRAAQQLYLTQPAVTQALRRLERALGARVFVRQGRGLVLSSRGERLLADVKPHLHSLVDAALATPELDPRTSDRVVRIGLSDGAETWLLAPLLRVLEREAPRMRVIAMPVQFRTVGDALVRGRVDMAVTVADELPTSTRRTQLKQTGNFKCLYDPRHAKLGKAVSERAYFAHDHVIVSYNGDLRGVVEDALGRSRRVRCSLASFSHVGAIVDGTAMLATVPDVVARFIRATYPHLRTATLPFQLPGNPPIELLWPIASDDDPACRFVRGHLLALGGRSRDNG